MVNSQKQLEKKIADTYGVAKSQGNVSDEIIEETLRIINAYLDKSPIQNNEQKIVLGIICICKDATKSKKDIINVLLCEILKKLVETKKNFCETIQQRIEALKKEHEYTLLAV
jgi:type IV secretory pathway VirB4 component